MPMKKDFSFFFLFKNYGILLETVLLLYDLPPTIFLLKFQRLQLKIFDKGDLKWQLYDASHQRLATGKL